MAQRRKTTKARSGDKAKPDRKGVAPAPVADSAVDFVREATRLHIAGKLAEAVPLYQQALAQNRGPAVLNNLGAALRDLKRPKEAAPFFREAVERDPGYADGSLNLGLTLHDIGEDDSAEIALKRALELLPRPAPGRPTDPRTLQAIGAYGAILRSRQRLDDQIALYRQAVEQAPDDATLHCQLGSVYFDLSKLPEALAEFEAAARLDPKLVAAQGNLGTTYSTLGRAEEAVACQHRAIALEPENPKHYVNLGAALKAQGLLGEAADAYRKAAALKPDYDFAVNNLGNLLREQGALHEAIGCFREAMRISPDYLTAHSNLLFTLNSLPELSAEEIYAEHRRFGEIVESKAPPPQPHANVPDPERRLRIGYLSPDFLGHSVAYFIENLLEQHDRRQVEVVCYALNKRSDSLSRRLQARADIWRSCSFLSDEELAALIRADGIDILVELAGHTAENRLAMMAHRPAPVQVTYLGYPNTTGLKAIDYRFTDALVDPVGEADRTHSEKLVRLPRSFLCYRPSDFAGEVPPRPSLDQGYVTFGSFNVLAKMTDEVIAAWVRILKQVPKSRLLLKCNSFTDPETVALYRRRFADLGLPENRIDLMGRQPLIGDHLAMYGRVDIALDPFPYNGTTTTCEALHMGVPMVTLRGARHVGRVSAALLHHVGLDELVADTVEDYVAKAVALARDPLRLQAMSAGLRPRMAASPLMDAPGFAREVEAAYRQMWRAWCAGRAVVSGDAAPATAEADIRAGAALFERGDFAGAEQAFRRAAKQHPDNPEAMLNLGTALKRQRRLLEALDCFQKAVALRPSWGAAHSNLGSALCDLGRLDEAEVACRRAIELDPKNRNAHSNLASVFAARRKDLEAIPLFQKALEIGPPSAELYVNLSAACIASGRLEEAVAACRHAIALQPDLAEAHANLASALGAQGRLHQSIAAARDVVKLQPKLHLAWSNLLFSLNYADDMSAAAVSREHVEWGRHLLDLAATGHANSREPGRRLRIGFISADFCAHSVAFFLKPLFDRHDRKGFEFACYSDVVNPDLYTDFLKAGAGLWRSTVGLTDERVAAMIREDGVDILIDIAGHTSKNRLGVFARKPAPVQVTWLGYPNTTGLAAIDWRFVDAITDPPETADALAVERIRRLPAPFLCYEAAPKTPDVAPLPALKNGHVTFGCFNKINKISDRTVRLWARVLAAVPNSRMILKSMSFNDGPTRDRLTGIMAEAGIAGDRITLLGWEPALRGHLEVYHRVDIALDTYPYNGTTTTCEAAWMGVPTVTLCGDRHAARVGATINAALGLDGLAPHDEDGVVAAAAGLASDTRALAELRRGLRDRMRGSSLCDAAAFAGKFEAALRDVWRDWCGTAAVAAGAVVPAERGKVLRLKTRGGFEIHVPDDPTLITPYILLEQEDWFEEEVSYIRGLLQPGERVVDIGANYGVYTLSAAGSVGPQGRVWSFEPASRTSGFLSASAAANGFAQVSVIRAGLSNRVGTASLKLSEQAEYNSLDSVAQGDTEQTETVTITTLDAWAAENDWPDIDFLKLDAEGEESNIVRAGGEFLSRRSPLVMFEVKHGHAFNLDLLADFTVLGYQPYRLVPALGLLMPFQPDEALRGSLFNLFCCKPDRAAKLAARGLLAEQKFSHVTAAEPLWPRALAGKPYAAPYLASWTGAISAEPELAIALDAWCCAADAGHAPARRIAALAEAVEILRRLAQAKPSLATLMSFARAARDFGYRGLAVSALTALSSRLETEAPAANLPFLAPLPRYETIPNRGDFAGWCRAAVLEALVDGSSFSSLFGEADTALLDAARRTGLHDVKLDRAAQLVRMRRKQAPERPLPARLLVPAPDNLNAAYWNSLVTDSAAGIALLGMLPEIGRINIVDIGAMALGDEAEPYRPLLRAGKARVIGFEPNQGECDKLNATAGDSRYYPYFIGDGTERVFYETNMPMTGSLYKPNAALLKKFHFLEELTRLVGEHSGIKTRRLDDLADLDGLDDIDLIKIDIQGAELDVFRGAAKALSSALVIITEVEFIPLYEDQPLFGDVDRYLRQNGFQFHTFKGFGRRFFKPFNSPKDPRAAFRQMLWSDAVFVKDFMHLDRLTDEKLLKMAVILDATLESYDLAGVVLAEYDRRHDTAYAEKYVGSIIDRWERARAVKVGGAAS